MQQVVVGVSGGIAAYKVCSVVRSLAERANTCVTVIPTDSALNFVGKATWEALSHQPVHMSVFDNVSEVAHIVQGKNSDLVVVAPATADIIAQLAHGNSHSLLTATVLTARCPVIVFPAMHTEMYEHPATQKNLELLRQYGYIVVNPAIGRLTGSDTGIGRLPEPEEIVHLCQVLLDKTHTDLPYDLKDKKVIISAGGTREALDPVRFLTNKSSGKQGYALATIAHARGAQVTLVSAAKHLPIPAGVELISVSSAQEMHDVMMKHSSDKDIIIMAAAVADFRPNISSGTKLKKKSGAENTLYLQENPDILRKLVEKNSERDNHLPKPLIIGFAAETGDAHHSVLEYARMKLHRKGCDLLVVNAVGNEVAFEVDDNSGWILDKNLREEKLERGSKYHIANAIFDYIQHYFNSAHSYNNLSI